MSKETLQHTMRSKVRVFEDGGIRLLRKGQKGLIHAIFSRFGLVLVLLVLQFGALFSLMRWFSNLLPHYLGGTLLVTAAMMVYLLNQDMNNSVRIPWLVVTALAPVLGVLLFCYTKEDVGHRHSYQSTVWGLCFHSIFDGVAIGAAMLDKNPRVLWIIFFAIALHKSAAAFGLGAYFKKLELTMRECGCCSGA